MVFNRTIRSLHRSCGLGLAVVLGLFCLSPAVSQVITMKEVDGKQVWCARSGLSSTATDCGFQSDWYTYIFVGSISEISSIEGDEKRIQVVPEEVFRGRPVSPLTVLTSQAACLPKLRVGDRWLFLLREQKNKPIVLDYGGNDSLPIANSMGRINTFRRLSTIGDFGILRGTVFRSKLDEGKVAKHAAVSAQPLNGNTPFGAITDADGRFEFEPLPPGRYKLSVAPIGSFQPDQIEIGVGRGSCRDVSLSRSEHAHLGGRVRRPDGSPVPRVDVIILSADNTWFVTTQSDAEGHFFFDSLGEGEFVIGAYLPDAPRLSGSGAGPGLSIPVASAYYNGVTERSLALVINLKTDETRDDLDFIIPPQ